MYLPLPVGPLPKTNVDFWRLVWQERSPSIVMVTNLREGNKVKCHQYWPESGSKKFGPFQVTITNQQTFADYIIRTFSVQVSQLECVSNDTQAGTLNRRLPPLLLEILFEYTRIHCTNKELSPLILADVQFAQTHAFTHTHTHKYSLLVALSGL